MIKNTCVGVQGVFNKSFRNKSIIEDGDEPLSPPAAAQIDHLFGLLETSRDSMLLPPSPPTVDVQPTPEWHKFTHIHLFRSRKVTGVTMVITFMMALSQCDSEPACTLLKQTEADKWLSVIITYSYHLRLCFSYCDMSKCFDEKKKILLVNSPHFPEYFLTLPDRASQRGRLSESGHTHERESQNNSLKAVNIAE